MGIETELLVKAVAKGFEGIEKNFKDLETAEEKAAVKAAVLSRESNRLSQELADGKKNLAQVTSEMKKLDDSMPIDGLQEMGDETSSLSTKWQEMSSKIDVAKQAFAAVAGTAQAVFDTMKEGATIKAASDNFDTLTESMGGATPALEGMRGATKGMVDDMTLMSSANALMTMGIASTSEELAKNVQIVTRLKKPTDDAATAMENWALLMANQSLPRLDSFGISSGAVRVRIKELMEATEGLTREQAFNTAVLAEAEISMTKVADASEGQLANIERLEAGWANLKNTMSVAVADALVPAVETAGNMATQTQEMAEAADSGHSAWSNALVVMNELNKTMGGIPADEWVQGVRDAESASIMLKDQLILVDEAMSSFDASITQNTTNLDLQSERLAANAQAAIDYSADMAAAAGEDENLTDKLGQQNNMLTESETQLIKSQQATDTLSASAKAASDNTALLGASATITAEQISLEKDRAEGLTTALGEIPSVAETVTIGGLDDAISKANSLKGLLGGLKGKGSGGGVTSVKGGDVEMATGGSFVIPPGFNNDSFPLAPGINAQSGETVTVTPAGQSAGGNNIVINVNGVGNPSAVASRVNDTLKDAYRRRGEV